MIFLKLLVAGHLTIYITRNDGALWQRPFPAWRLIVVAEGTQILGTLAAVYGWIVEPIGWANGGPGLGVRDSSGCSSTAPSRSACLA